MLIQYNNLTCPVGSYDPSYFTCPALTSAPKTLPYVFGEVVVKPLADRIISTISSIIEPVCDESTSRERTVDNINKIAKKKYKFKVFDWDNRGGRNGAGPYLIEKVKLIDPSIPPDYSEQQSCSNIERESDVTCYDWNSRSSNEEIARLFSEILVRYQNVEIKGSTFKATSIHTRRLGTATPFLFIMGKKLSQGWKLF